MRSGSFRSPNPLVAFDCGSQSTSSVLTSAAAREAVRLMAVVVFPTPPFWLATAMTRPIFFVGETARASRSNQPVNSMPYFGAVWECSTWNTPHEKLVASQFHSNVRRGTLTRNQPSRSGHTETEMVLSVPRGTWGTLYCDGKEETDAFGQIAEVFHVEHSAVVRITMRTSNILTTRMRRTSEYRGIIPHSDSIFS